MSALLCSRRSAPCPTSTQKFRQTLCSANKCLEDVGLTCARKHCAAKRYILLIVNSRRSNLNFHFDDQWHTVFVDCMCPPAINDLDRGFSGRSLIDKEPCHSFLSVPRILRSNPQFVLSDAPSSCSTQLQDVIRLFPFLALSVFNFYVTKTELFMQDM